MNKNRVIHGAIALIRVQGVTIGRMRQVSATENFNRVDVQGLGTIFSSEKPVVKWTGNLTCEFMSIDFATEGIKDAVRRNLPNIASRVFEGEISFEDQLSIDSSNGVQVDIFKKIEDVLNPDGTIKPKAVPYAVVQQCLIESDSFNISEGSVGGHSQSFSYLKPIQLVQ